MISYPAIRTRLCPVIAALTLLAPAGHALSEDAPIVQPGAPGQPPRGLSADEAVEIANTGYSPDDVRFMQDMIPHHHQAMQMAALVDERTNRPEIVDLAGRIAASQNDEITFMQKWLRDRGQPVPDPADHDRMHVAHAMAGMATPEQMEELAGADAVEFDRLFLELMIAHHEGALTMVEDLLEQPGSAYDPVLFEFTSDVVSDQTAEIERMHALLLGLSSDPRARLAAGLHDAGQAAKNMELVASLPRPPGFFDPRNPVEVPPRVLQQDADGDQEAAGEPQPAGHDHADPRDERVSIGEDDEARTPLLTFSNTDLAFAGDLMVAGSYHGFNAYRLQADGVPELITSVVCPGGQGDVSIVGDLLLMSVEETRGRLDCGLQGVTGIVSPERFRGLRIFDISDITRPVQVGAVQTCRGSHTHSVVAGPEGGRIIVYNSGTSTVRDERELEGCVGEIAGDERTALFRIDVIEIPIDDPSRARIIDSPTVFADPEKGTLAGLWRGGDHGDDTQESSVTDQCHDITVFPAKGIAAGACSGNGIIFDISDPLKPTRIDAVVDTGFAYWHSATFNNDGTKVLFTDEWGGGSMARCRAYDPLNWGANAIYDIIDNRLVFRSYFKLPAPQVEQENCVAHNGSIVPVPGRDIFVQAWYQGGVSVIDFTDSAKPVEIAYFDRGPLNADELIFGGYWSTYWYNGKVYGTETMRGLDVLALVPSDILSANEIAAAELADQGERFNPQQQFPVTWPADPVVARAYMDQLERAGTLPPSTLAELNTALDAAAARLANGTRDRRLAGRLRALAEDMDGNESEAVAARRLNGLAATLSGLAARLR